MKTLPWQSGDDKQASKIAMEKRSKKVKRNRSVRAGGVVKGARKSERVLAARACSKSV